MSSRHTQAELGSRFRALWQRCCPAAGGDDTERVWQALLTGYGEAHRHYHGIGHLESCLREHDLAATEMEDPDAVEMAIWFHDLVYAPGSRLNESDSADLFRRLAAGVCPESFSDRVASLILITTHRDQARTRDEELVCDIDLAGLGHSWAAYLSDTLALGREQPPGTQTRYSADHRHFLEALLRRDRIYYTDFFHTRYEQAACKNIRRYLRLIQREA
jgi:predicted metal-dependent HD superfamily phosphohydrolase